MEKICYNYYKYEGRLLSKTLKEVLIENKIVLRESGNRWVATCPFHDGDNEPSFTVYPNDTYFCFGCQVWGDVVRFLVQYKKWDPKQALEYVGEDYQQVKTEKSKIIKIRNTTQTWRFLWDCVLQYHDFLLRMPGAISYLKTRGLTEETIKKFKIGYTDGKILNLRYVWERQLADEIGLMSRSGHESLSHRITIPNLLEEGQADFVIGRTVINDKVKYLGARMPKPILGFYRVRHSQIIFLVEGQFDWLTLCQWGYPAVCIGGTHLTRYSRLPLLDKDIVIIPDLDDVGLQGAFKLKETLGQKSTILDWSNLRKNPTEKFDISSLAEQGDGEQQFKDLLVRKLPWILTFSKPQLKKWFPNLQDMTLLHLT